MKRNYKVMVKAYQKDENGVEKEILIPSYETEDVNIAQYVKGLFTEKAVTRNDDGTPKEDHTLRNVGIAAAVLAGGYYLYSQSKEEPQVAPQIPQYQPQPVYQIPAQTQQYAPQPQMVTRETQFGTLETTIPTEVEPGVFQSETSDGTQITEF